MNQLKYAYINKRGRYLLFILFCFALINTLRRLIRSEMFFIRDNYSVYCKNLTIRKMNICCGYKKSMSKEKLICLNFRKKPLVIQIRFLLYIIIINALSGVNMA